MLPVEKLIEKYGKPEAILLDWDNTLADSWGVIYKSLNKAFRGLGMEEWSFDDVQKGRDNIHHSLRESFPRIFGNRWEEARDLYYKSFLECHLDEIKLLPEAENTLKSLKELDAHIAIVSNKTNKYLRDELNHLNISHYFDEIVGAGDAVRDKPHKEPLLLALSSSTILEENFPTKVWMIGDSKTDIEAAINTNCIPILYGDADISNFISENKIDIQNLYKINNHLHFQELLNKF